MLCLFLLLLKENVTSKPEAGMMYVNTMGFMVVNFFAQIFVIVQSLSPNLGWSYSARPGTCQNN